MTATFNLIFRTLKHFTPTPNPPSHPSTSQHSVNKVNTSVLLQCVAMKNNWFKSLNLENNKCIRKNEKYMQLQCYEL